MTESLLERVERHEGFRSKPYQDSLGVWTFGHGLTYITEDESMMIVRGRLQLIRNAIARHYPWVANSPEDVLDVLTEMQYQLGETGLSRFAKFLSALEAGDYAEAAKEGKDSKWHTQTPERCEELMQIIEDVI